MKYSKLLLALSLTFVATSSIADTRPTEVALSFDKVYVPDGFDDNDNVQITGEGLFRNTCYRYADSKVRVDDKTKTIHISSTAYHYNGPCLMVVLPFNHVVDVGLLKSGTYSIVDDNSNRTLSQMNIRKATSAAPDDYMYAPISQAFFQTQNGVNKIFLSGDFPVSCMKFTEIKIHFQSDVIVLQPIVHLDQSVPCEQGKFHFEASTTVNAPKTGRYLIHVRSMNGKSVNSVVEIPTPAPTDNY